MGNEQRAKERQTSCYRREFSVCRLKNIFIAMCFFYTATLPVVPAEQHQNNHLQNNKERHIMLYCNYQQIFTQSVEEAGLPAVVGQFLFAVLWLADGSQQLLLLRWVVEVNRMLGHSRRGSHSGQLSVVVQEHHPCVFLWWERWACNLYSFIIITIKLYCKVSFLECVPFKYHLSSQTVKLAIYAWCNYTNKPVMEESEMDDNYISAF